MTFKALLYKCYARKGPIGAGSKRHGRHVTIWNFLAYFLWHLDELQIIAKIIHLSTEMDNN